MAEDNSVLEKARRRSRSRTVRRALDVIFALMFLACVGGFARGMWGEVARAPEKYAAARNSSRTTFIGSWSIRAAQFITGIQAEKPDRAAGPEDLALNTRPRGSGAGQGTRTPRIQNRTPNTEHRTPSRPEPPPDYVGPVDIEPKDPPVAKPEPRETGPSEPPEPANPPTNVTLPRKEPLRPPKEYQLDAATQDMLDKAHQAYDTGWKYHLQSRPEAPPAGRDAATKNTIKHMEEAKKLYYAVLDRRIPDELKKRIEARLVQLQGILFWSYKFSTAK